jgi:hypothetical protein
MFAFGFLLMLCYIVPYHLFRRERAWVREVAESLFCQTRLKNDDLLFMGYTAVQLA